MGKSLTEAAKEVLLKEDSTENSATLKPRSRYTDPPKKLEGEVEDLGEPVDQPDDPGTSSFRAAKTMGKDKSRSAITNVEAESMKRLSEEELEEDTDQIDEDLDNLISSMLDEGYTEEEITEALDSMLAEEELEEENLDEGITRKLSRYANAKSNRKKVHDKIVKQLLNIKIPMPGTEGPSFEGKLKRLRQQARRAYAVKTVKSNLSDLAKSLPKSPGSLGYMRGDKLEEDTGQIDEDLDNLISSMLDEGYTEEEITEALDSMLAEEELEEDTGQTAPVKPQIDMSEHVNALLEGENLSEDFRIKATTIFESAVNSKLEEELETIEEAYEKSLLEQAASMEKNMEEQLAKLYEDINDYLNYVVEQWVSENEVAIESGLRSELTEDFIAGFRQLCAEHYIDIPEEKVQVVEELGSKVENLEEKLDEEISRNVSLTKTINEYKKQEAIFEASENLTDTQTAKLRNLAENMEFNTTQDFAHKLQTIKENYFPNMVNSDGALDQAESSIDGKGMISEQLQGPMASYVKTLGKTIK